MGFSFEFIVSIKTIKKNISELFYNLIKEEYKKQFDAISIFISVKRYDYPDFEIPFTNNNWSNIANIDKIKFLNMHTDPWSSLVELESSLRDFIGEQSIINEKIKQFILFVEKDYSTQQSYKEYFLRNTTLNEIEIDGFFNHFKPLNGKPINQKELADILGIDETNLIRSDKYKIFFRHTAYYSFINNGKYKANQNKLKNDLNEIISNEWNNLTIHASEDIVTGNLRTAKDNGDLPDIWKSLADWFNKNLKELFLRVAREHGIDLINSLKVEEIVKSNNSLIVTWDVIPYGTSLAQCKLYFFINSEKKKHIIENTLEARLFFREYCKKIYNTILDKIYDNRVVVASKLKYATKKNYRGKKE